MLRTAEGLLPASERLSPKAYRPVKAVAQTLAPASRKTKPATKEVGLFFMIITLRARDSENRKPHTRQHPQECEAERSVARRAPKKARRIAWSLFSRRGCPLTCGPDR